MPDVHFFSLLHRDVLYRGVCISSQVCDRDQCRTWSQDFLYIAAKNLGYSETLVLQKGCFGQPFSSQLGVGVSHAFYKGHGRLSLLAYPRELILGIDVESVFRNTEPVFRRYLSPGELEWASTTLVGWEWTALWTAKEAVAKALGIGLLGSPRELFSVAAAHRFSAVDGREGLCFSFVYVSAFVVDVCRCGEWVYAFARPRSSVWEWVGNA